MDTVKQVLVQMEHMDMTMDLAMLVALEATSITFIALTQTCAGTDRGTGLTLDFVASVSTVFFEQDFN
jgi:hypothetical protein